MYKTVIVEDDIMVSSINQNFAQRTPGIKVIATFLNGTDALHFLKENTIDLLLLDLYMPDISGLELLREIRKENMSIDVIMITAANDMEHLQEALQLGIIDYLVKPFQYERFSESLNKFILKKTILQNGSAFTQEEIDRFISNQPSTKVKKSLPLQKGLQQKTLDRVLACLETHSNEYVTSELISEEISLSQVTTRRYLNYLVDVDEVKSRVNYSTGGRPSLEYIRCLPSNY